MPEAIVGAFLLLIDAVFLPLLHVIYVLPLRVYDALLLLYVSLPE